MGPLLREEFLKPFYDCSLELPEYFRVQYSHYQCSTTVIFQPTELFHAFCSLRIGHFRSKEPFFQTLKRFRSSCNNFCLFARSAMLSRTLKRRNTLLVKKYVAYYSIPTCVVKTEVPSLYFSYLYLNGDKVLTTWALGHYLMH